ncbi:hypothetical protein EJ04DRAFT_443322 [Polyplosphaeria fusca]|uniref:Aminoglycoside phosphotransferase domain-containing protein n=1 Tax=Polyplosphaeria fusca TaxID=682080 RepID=A0A9P4QUP0_9PLEO|nr:hypothetical protein EJ04DRAFT_443322 [Polyplosphaeria fusca]
MLCSVTDIGRGSFNRVIGVDLFDPTPSGTTVSSIVRPWFIRSSKLPAGRYVLRIPIKQWQSWPEHEIAIHRYIEAYTAIPAPRFAFSDLTDQNEIGSVYMIQSRVPGNNIVNSFKELNFDQTMSLASQIGAHMHDLGLFHDSEHYLAHLDLEPRNMMYEVVDEKTVKLTGFIDWDSAVFAPRFMHCKTPQWLWAWDRLTVEHERDALDEPYVYESIAIKKAFDEAAGASFCHYAYSHDYRVARRLFQLAINPAMVTRAKQEAYLLMYRWNMLHPDHEVYMTEMEIRSARFSDLAEV